MWIGVVSLFPEMFRAIIDYGVTGRAIKNNLLNLFFWNPRNFVQNRRRSVDDRLYGGGPGMLIQTQPIKDAIIEAKSISGKGVHVIYLSPQGKKLDQIGILKLKNIGKLILVCGRYEGIDERLIQMEVDEEWSIGDYVLSGGELPAMTLIDSISRFIPGVLGDQYSASKDSFANGLLDCPHYTRPQVIDGLEVPPVLLSGNHEKIRLWRLKQSLGRTWIRRPELLKKINLTGEQKELLDDFQKENVRSRK